MYLAACGHTASLINRNIPTRRQSFCCFLSSTHPDGCNFKLQRQKKLMNSVGLRYPSICLRGERVKCLKRHKLNTRLPVIIIHTSCRHHKALISTGLTLSPLLAARSTLQSHPHCCRVLLCRVSYTQPNN